MRFWAGAIFLGLLGHAACAAEPERDWKIVPGHKNILVDMASIQPLKKEFFEVNLPSGWTHDRSRPYEMTSAAISLNGHLREHNAIYCSGITVKGVRTYMFPDSDKVMGVIPEGVVEAMVCPKARELAPSP